MTVSLIQKYNVAGPRYTSYPTVPYWDNESFSNDKWLNSLKRSFHESNKTEGISLYIHLPFCESLCTFCGCHKRITKRHEMESPYIDAVLKEWKLYLDVLQEKPLIKEIHLGGGTPTFFKPEELKRLLEGIFEYADIAKDKEFSFEGHPNNTTETHLRVLYSLGFERVSFGVQDYSLKVQKAIHRIQPFENVKKVTEWARKIGYKSVSHDLVFGLPFQTLDDVLFTIDKTNSLHPDRIAFYSYAHVPWIKGSGQRGFDESNLPSGEEKRLLYETGKKHLIDAGYVEIGMDHFALPTDSMYKSFETNSLHRNFMGYTASKTQVMIGLGMSSISDSWYGFAQNEKDLEDYYARIQRNEIPVFRGHILNEEDLIIRQHILNLMCHFNTSWEEDKMYTSEIESIKSKLNEMVSDGLIELREKSIRVTNEGRPFVRNLCMAFDLRLQRNIPNTKIFSMTV
ncbi:Coproporphyrinogen-III oxidase [Capnocytophaga canis]|uniref:Coproporphyrinogen-III oxidase n=1 Tax=Capnocytophaga canis TaxID=1848903 RepID=A0A0B7HUQ2_9FLAO|nr:MULTISPECIES: oxygen-independent coproporphyrinogen III oxidase [Capnocytophaga]ATA74380.1 oxygen-independent coproporphyrinogen III oxidase [Capnocytophaga sp. H2931]GIM60154.1 coproporphyrinogen-III oxidase [Capnocytophaga canis]CEN42364.1 Coproporphyrinogen-III oxidase [Capnocytophaga canis]CEN53745.1 Coproporphyrinogen-III oxidase [Capnocytophaga canis]